MTRLRFATGVNIRKDLTLIKLKVSIGGVGATIAWIQRDAKTFGPFSGNTKIRFGPGLPYLQMVSGLTSPPPLQTLCLHTVDWAPGREPGFHGVPYSLVANGTTFSYIDWEKCPLKSSDLCLDNRQTYSPRIENIGSVLDNKSTIILGLQNRVSLKSFEIYSNVSKELAKLGWPIYQKMGSDFARKLADVFVEHGSSFFDISNRFCLEIGMPRLFFRTCWLYWIEK